MPKLIKTLIIVNLMFFTLFPIHFVFLPAYIHTRLIIAALGFLFWFLSIISNRRKCFSKKIITIFLISFLISVWSLLSTLIFNSADDFTYVNLPITLAIIFFSAYACITIIKVFDKQISFSLITKYFIYTILLQSFFVLIQFFNSDIASFLTTIQRLAERRAGIATHHFEEGTRFIGFGLFFYTASLFYGTALVLLAHNIKNRYLSSTEKFKGILLFLFLFLIGMGLSRSTIIGFTSALLLLFISLSYNSINLNKILRLIVYTLTVSAVITLFLILNSGFLHKFEALFNNAFDFIISYFNKGQVESNSAQATISSFVLPEDKKIYIFGTGIFTLFESTGSYNYSDVGYSRLLYYFGLPGMLMFFWLEIKLLKLAFYRERLKPIFYSMLIILFITNIKGITSLAVISTLYALIPHKSLKSN